MACVVVVGTVSAVAGSAAAGTPVQQGPNVLLIGHGPSDPTTAAWQSALSSEGVAYTLATASGPYGSETVTLPALTTGPIGNFTGVVIADSPAAFADGQLSALDSYESSSGVRQVDGYTFPSPSLGLTSVSSGSLDNSTAQLTPAGLAALPGLQGTVTFDVGSYGYAASVVAGAPFTPWLENSTGNVLAGVYQHSGDAQDGVSELVLTFDYNATQLQWLLLAPGLVNWVTQETQTSVPPNQGSLAGPVVGIAPRPKGDGYWLANAAGDVSPHGAAESYGSLAGTALNAPIAHIVATRDGKGYWLVAADGGVFAFGDARFYGSMGGRHLNSPVVSLGPTADSLGYWLVAADGGVFAFGDAGFHGSMGGQRLNKPVVGIAADSTTGGYWLVATDGGIFAFGGAPFQGSTGYLALNKPVNGMAVSVGDEGYWLVAADGGIFAFGDAGFHGSMGGQRLNKPVVGIAADNTTYGYWLVSADGGIYSFGAPFYGAD
jgi:hypothetical protein